MLDLFPKESNESARQYAIRVLRHNILHTNLRPGQLISEGEIGEQLGLSRTPIREAFKDLATADIVKIEPQKGTFVSTIDFGLVRDACFLRLTMEKAIMEQVCQSITPEYIDILEENMFMCRYYVERQDQKKWFTLDNAFHRLIYQACGRERIYDYIENLMFHFDRIRVLSLKDLNMEKAFSEHVKLLEIVKERNAQKAVEAIEAHLSSCIVNQAFIEKLQQEYA